MQDHQFLKSLPSLIVKDATLLGFWFFQIPGDLQPITNQEQEWANQLAPMRKRQYQYSRGYARHSLSQLFVTHPLKIPLYSLPGKPPKLSPGWGNISISHCKDGLLIGWSAYKVGVDIERSDRKFNTEHLIKRFSYESNEINKLDTKNRQKQIINDWVIQEAVIKSYEGNLYRDWKEWKIEKNSRMAFHKGNGHEVYTYLVDFMHWSIGIALEKECKLNAPILCIDL